MGMAGSNRRKPKAHPKSSSPSPAMLEFTIDSDNDASRKVQIAVLAELSKRGFNTNAAYAIRLALEEGMQNAIRHGNRLNPKKKVHIKAQITSEAAEIIIEDQGVGFDRSKVPDPTLDENLEKCSGRGILLIERYMNKVEWSNGGRRLRMIKRNEPDLFPRS
jgi:serine/threonine-protein kinase RsbW